MNKVIAICGKICSGKTYYAARIKAAGNAVLLSCDEVTKALFDNDLGEKHDEMTLKIRNYLMAKAVELVDAGCDVILDHGFWRKEDRIRTAELFRRHNIPCQWHYVDVDDETWYQNIQERNCRILSGEGGSDYYLDEGLMDKLLSAWEAPAEEEIDVRYTPKRG